jgi:hypothetical protein
VSSQAAQIVVGKYNNTTNDVTGNHASGVFIIGAGTSVTRKNVFRVLEDGGVLIQPSGDISMGQFGAGEQP